MLFQKQIEAAYDLVICGGIVDRDKVTQVHKQKKRSRISAPFFCLY